MNLTESIREQVRHRAQGACEFCGITKIDVLPLLLTTNQQLDWYSSTETLAAKFVSDHEIKLPDCLFLEF